MRILVIDGQGGRLGRQLVESLRAAMPDALIHAVGTNSVATATMLKAGADDGATGTNPVVVAARKADVITGPIGIVIADSLMGEVTPEMAVAVAQSDAVRVLIPMNLCGNLVAGLTAQSVNELIADAVDKIIKSARKCEKPEIRAI